jgi:SAM-dependent methyltransferase
MSRRQPGNLWLDEPRVPIVTGMVDAEIAAYYERGLERDRLASGRQRIEFLRIWDLLERCLPAAPARVVDVGGGAGAYAIPLAAAGYEVHLIDPVPLHVAQAAAASRQAGTPLAAISAGDARELPVADGSAGAVLLLGPLYHLTSRDDRLTALREARRALRPGGVVIAKALSRFYPVFEELAGGMPVSRAGLDGTARFLSDGQYRNPGGDPRTSRPPTSTVRRNWPARSRTPAWNCGGSSPPAGASSSCQARRGSSTSPKAASTCCPCSGCWRPSRRCSA